MGSLARNTRAAYSSHFPFRDESPNADFVQSGAHLQYAGIKMLKSDKLRLLLVGTTILIATLACGATAGSPISNQAPTVEVNLPSGSGEITPEPTQAPITAVPFVILSTPTEEQPSEPAPVAPPPAIPESRRLTLEYPPKIRTGDSDVIRLTLEVDTLGNLTPTAEVQGNLVTGQVVQIPNLYDTHYVIAEARLDLAGLEVRPSEAVSEPLLPGQPVTFYWSVRPDMSGTFRGTAWLFLNFRDKVTGAESRKAISAQPVQIEATSFLGLNGSVARTAGGGGSVVGAVLGFPFADDIFKWLLGRLKRKG
jgi:hypothetical protein